MTAVHMSTHLAAGAGTIPYTTFEGHLMDLKPWPGEHVALLTPPDLDLDPQVVACMIAALDEAWEYYSAITGREPTPWAGTTYQGLATIAVVDETCGAGCGYLGFTGIEILQSFFETAYQELAQTGRHDQILFYELGRNFWFYGDQLGTIDAFVTGFAIVNRFQSMEAAGLEGYFQGGNFEAVSHAIRHDMAQLYLADSGTDGLEALTTSPPANPRNFGTADLAASLFYRIQEDFGDEAYAQFWQALGSLPQAQTPQQAIDNFVQAAQSATSLDYSALFKTGWTLQVGDASNDSLILGGGVDPQAAFGFDGHDRITGSASTDHLFGGGRKRCALWWTRR